MVWSDATRRGLLSTLKDIEVLATAHLAASKDLLESTEARGNTLVYIYEHNPHTHAKDTLVAGITCTSAVRPDGLRYLADTELTFPGIEHVALDAQGNALVPVEDPLFDSLHVYGVARSVVGMYATSVASLRAPAYDVDAGDVEGEPPPAADRRRSTNAAAAPWRWVWDGGVHALSGAGAAAPVTTALTLLPHDPLCGGRACYVRSKRAVCFGTLPRGDGGVEYLCRGVQVVAHELGHAILDALKPEIYRYKAGERAALHEAFADVTAIFFLCGHSHVAGVLLDACGGDLRSCVALSATGQQFMQGGGHGGSEPTNVDGDRPAHSPSLRDANNTVTMADIQGADDIDGLTELFSGFIYDLIVHAYITSTEPRRPVALGIAAADVRDMLITALCVHCSAEPTFDDVARGMLRCAPAAWIEYTATAATARGIRVRGGAARFVGGTDDGVDVVDDVGE